MDVGAIFQAVCSLISTPSCTVELGYNLMKGNDILCVFQKSVIISEDYDWYGLQKRINWLHRIRDTISEV